MKTVGWAKLPGNTIMIFSEPRNFAHALRRNCAEIALSIVRDSRPLTPSPRGGEGRDEGAPAPRYGNIVTPSPHPLPFGAREWNAVTT